MWEGSVLGWVWVGWVGMGKGVYIWEGGVLGWVWKEGGGLGWNEFQI